MNITRVDTSKDIVIKGWAGYICPFCGNPVISKTTLSAVAVKRSMFAERAGDRQKVDDAFSKIFFEELGAMNTLLTELLEGKKKKAVHRRGQGDVAFTAEAVSSIKDPCPYCDSLLRPEHIASRKEEEEDPAFFLFFPDAAQAQKWALGELFKKALHNASMRRDPQKVREAENMLAIKKQLLEEYSELKKRQEEKSDYTKQRWEDIKKTLLSYDADIKTAAHKLSVGIRELRCILEETLPKAIKFDSGSSVCYILARKSDENKFATIPLLQKKEKTPDIHFDIISKETFEQRIYDIGSRYCVSPDKSSWKNSAPKTKYCKKCAKEIPHDSIFCPFCGKSPITKY